MGHWINPAGSSSVDSAFWSRPIGEREHENSGIHYGFQPVVWFTGNTHDIHKRGFNQAHDNIGYIWGWDPKENGVSSPIGHYGTHLGLTFSSPTAKYILWLTHQYCFIEGVKTGDGNSFKKFSLGIFQSGGSLHYGGQGRWMVNRQAAGDYRSLIGQQEAHYFGLQWHLNIPKLSLIHI